MRLVFDDNRVALQQSNLLALQKSNPLHNPYRVTREHQFSKSQMLSNCRKNAIFEQIYNYLLKDEACTEVTYKKITSAYLPCEISELLQPMA